MYTCKKCGEQKEDTLFYTDSRSGTPKSPCKLCHRVMVYAWKARNKEKVKEIDRRSSFKRKVRVCPHCHEIFKIKSCQIGCSIRCRFYLSFQTVQSGCWEWTKGRIGSPKCLYGMMHINRKNKLAHRISYELHKGEIPEGRLVLHRCDNAKCVNPDHLYLGDAKQNAKDRQDRGRHNIKKVKFTNYSRDTAQKVLDLRKEGLFFKDIATQLGLTKRICQYIAERPERITQEE